ncbi:MAG TPA: hypothetical protein VFF53_08725 [Geobacteraceae bacterium]|nr:hypothetical protein [Geobacteraceae bacterium]
MVIDYSERRQSQRMQPKRPQRPSVWPYALLIIAMLFSAFLLGMGTGWYLYRPGGRFYKAIPQLQAQPAKPAPSSKPQSAPAAQPQVPQQQQPLNALPPADKSAPVPLTFYNTLQKGNKGLMGTGINQPREEQGGASKPSSPPQSGH